MSHRTLRTPQRTRDGFLAALERGLSVSGACKAAGVGRSTAYDLRASDEGFARGWDEAIDQGTDVLEDEAFRRACEGVEEPVISGGRQVLDAEGKPLVVRRYSDTLLTVLLEARRPKRFKDRMSADLRANVKIGADEDARTAVIYRLLDDLASRKSRGEPTPELDMLPS